MIFRGFIEKQPQSRLPRQILRRYVCQQNSGKAVEIGGRGNFQGGFFWNII